MQKIEIINHGQSGDYCRGELTKEQYGFWNENEDYYIEEYVEEGCDYSEIEEIPTNANFLDGSEWYDFDDIDRFLLLGGYIIEIEIIIDGKKVFNGELQHFIEKFSPEIQNIDDNPVNADYYCEIIDIQRGKIFHGEFESNNFDFKKIKFEMMESEIKGIFYESEQIPNDYCETRSKGISVEVFRKSSN